MRFFALFAIIPNLALAWTFPGSDNRVVRNAVCVADGVLYVGGDFGEFGGAERAGAAAIDLASGQVLDWEPELGDGHVSAILEMDGILYLGGSIPVKGQESRGLLLAVESARQGHGKILGHWNPQPDKPVAALERGPQGSLFVGGRFSRIAGQPRKMLAQLGGAKNPSAAALPFQPSLDQRVTTLVWDPSQPSRLLVGGYFKGLFAAFGIQDSRPLPLPIYIEGTQSQEILRMILHQGRVYVAGVEIHSVSAQPRRNAFALDATSLALLPWRANLDAGAGALSAWGNTVYLGGDFRTVNGVPRRLAALDSVSGALQPLDPITDRNTYALQAFEGGLFASGYWEGFSAFLFNGRPSRPAPAQLSLLLRR